jgi:hypothetical protein
MTWTTSVRPYFRTLASVATTVILTVTLITTVSDAQADEHVPSIVGSFGVGGGLSGQVDESTGAFDIQVPVLSLPGLTGRGGVDIGVSYEHNLATAGVNRFGFGEGWSWSGSFVDTNDIVHISCWGAIF